MNSTKELVMKSFDQIQKGTEYVLQAIPMDKLDYGIKDSATISELAFHIATMPLGATLFAKGVFEKFPEFDVLTTEFEKYLGDSLKKKDYKTMFTKSCTVFKEFWESKTDDEWVNSTYSNFLTRGPRTYLEGYLSMQNHLLQHRGSLTSTLRSARVMVNLQQYWGMAPLE